MPVLKFTNDEIGTLLHGLRTEAGEWLRCKTLHGSAQNFNSVSAILKNTQALEARVQAVYDNMADEDDEEPIDKQLTEAEAQRRTAVAKMILSEIQVGEALHSGSIGPFLGGYPAEGMVWHHNHGWLHPRKYIEAAQADIEAGETTREEFVEIVDVDLVEVDAENARDRARLSAFLKFDLAEPWVDSDVDGDPFEITYPEEKAFPCWHDMENQSDGLIERPDGYRIAICRIRHTREGFKLGFSGPFRDMFRGHFRRYYPDLDSAKTAAEDIFRSGLERHGLALAS